MLEGIPTRLSPFSFVIFGLNPLGSACSKMSICPFRAASNSRPAKAMASGGSWSADAGGPGGAESMSVEYDFYGCDNLVSLIALIES
jgi:hypothetical protein